MAPVDSEIARVAERQYGVVSIRRLRSLGLSDSQIRRRVADGRLRRLHRGVYAVGHDQLTIRGRWIAAVIAAGPGALLSHRDAAALWGLLDSGSRAAIEVTVSDRGRRSRRRLTIHCVRQLHPDDRRVRDRIPVTSVARTLLDLTDAANARTLQRAYEKAEQLQLLDLRAIRALLDRSNGRRGVRALLELTAYDPAAAARARSEFERAFLDLVRECGWPEPQVNVSVDGFDVDCFWPHANLVVELDSWEHHRDRATFERDREKIAMLRLAGREVLPFTHRQLTDRRAWVIAAVEQLISRAPLLSRR